MPSSDFDSMQVPQQESEMMRVVSSLEDVSKQLDETINKLTSRLGLVLRDEPTSVSERNKTVAEGGPNYVARISRSISLLSEVRVQAASLLTRLQV